eukprot:scaffold13378_cov36-Prasinocladus_malaysianus.AAC.1
MRLATTSSLRMLSSFNIISWSCPTRPDVETGVARLYCPAASSARASVFGWRENFVGVRPRFLSYTFA